MIVPKTIVELKQLITDGIEESQQLEYKAAAALTNRTLHKDIAKDVSAMANASGGVIIYGVKEHNSTDKKHLPEAITPIKRDEFSKERLEQIINSNISPKIEGITIHPIVLSESEVAYAVEIPQSQTAHQSMKDYLYYRRYNFEVLPMQDYEIRDVMNRLKYPKIEMDFELVKHRYTESLRAQGLNVDEYRHKTTLTLKVRPHNVGSQFAQYINYFIEIPLHAMDDDVSTRYKKINEAMIEYYGENTIRDVLDVRHTPYGGAEIKYGPSRFDPVLPGLKGRAEEIPLRNGLMLGEHEIKWKVYADNAPVNSGSIKMIDIKYTLKGN